MRSFRVLSLLLLPSLLIAQLEGPVVFASAASKRVQVAELRSDGTFLLIRDTLEHRGTWSAGPGQVHFRPSEGEAFTADLSNDRLTIGTLKLGRWKEGTTAAQFISAFLQLRLRVQAIRAELRRDLQDLARAAVAHRKATGGFIGFTVPEAYRSTSYGTHEANVTSDRIVLKGTAKGIDGAVQATVMPTGELKEWTYYGMLM